MIDMLRKILFLPLVVLTTLVLSLLFVVIYLNVVNDALTELNVVEEGTAYGLTIGSSKDQVYSDLIRSIPIRKLVASGADIAGAPRRFSIVGPGAYDFLLAADYWHLKPSPPPLNVLKLYFQDGRLAKIRYFWSPGELP